MERLYISDLDGTLLAPNGKLSAFTGETLSALMRQGMPFTVSTARSPFSFRLVGLEALPLTLPVSLMNGVLIFDPVSDRVLKAAPLPNADEVVALCAAAGKSPLLFRVEDGTVMVDYTEPQTAEERVFLEARRAHYPHNYRRLAAHTAGEEAVFASVHDRYEVLLPVYEALCAHGGWRVNFYRDSYEEGIWFLEVSGPDGGKDNGVRHIQALTGATYVTVFGDNRNDLPLFEAADCALAVDNADETVKAAADGIIGANADDGVVRYLQKEWKI